MSQKDLISHIKEHQNAIGKYPLAPYTRMQYIRDLTLATHVELTEFINELQWKPWKRYEDNDIYTEELHAAEALEELVDVSIFVLDLWLALDPNVRTIEIIAAINKKLDDNLNRLDNKEHKIHGR